MGIMEPKILVVEDDLDTQGYSKTVLERAGFRVEVCGAAAAALSSFQAERPALVVIDIGLPDFSGFILCREMGLGDVGGTPFIFLTGKSDLQTRLECFRLGAHDYIQKPFSVQELLARVQVHLKLKASHDQLLRRNYELELRGRARQDLADMIVHDLKTPLTSIMGTLDLIKSHGLITDVEYVQIVEYAGTAADFMLFMLNDLLDVGQARQVGLKPEFSVVELEPLLARLKVLFAARCRRRNLSMDYSLTGAVKTFRMDQNLVFRVLVNLLSNAMQASRPGQDVRIECLPCAGGLRLEVLDRGRGVPDAEKERIFDKYSTTKRAAALVDAGSGLGLTFCRLACEAHKGRIWVEDRDGGGSRFVVELP